jgi:hypothetical protein
MGQEMSTAQNATSGAATGAAAGSVAGPWGAVVGALIGGLASAFGSSNTNSSQRRLSKYQMAWQTMMSNTAYQRQRADLEKAGYNPMLAMKTAGASTPQGNMPILRNPLGEGATSAIQAMSTVATAQLQNSQMKLNEIESQMKNHQINKEEAKGKVYKEVNKALDVVLEKTSTQQVKEKATGLLKQVQKMATWLFPLPPDVRDKLLGVKEKMAKEDPQKSKQIQKELDRIFELHSNVGLKPPWEDGPKPKRRDPMSYGMRKKKKNEK